MQRISNHRGLLFSLLAATIALGSAFALAVVVEKVTPPTTEPPHVPQTHAPLDRPTPTGRALFRQSCAHCHGDDAEGTGDGPDLHDLRISDARIATVIRQGIHGEMPSFAKKHSAADIALLTAYLRQKDER